MKNTIVYGNALSYGELSVDRETAHKAGISDALRKLDEITKDGNKFTKDYAQLNADEIRAAAKDIITACDGGYIEEYRQVTKRKGK